MDISTIDYWAVHGRSPLHRASAPSKLLAAGLLIAAVVIAQDPFSLAATYLLVAAGIAFARLPLLRLLALAAYPAVFALLFAVSQWTGSLMGSLVIIGKAMTAAATMVLLITTTPYPQLFALLRRFLPGIVADGLLLTYRSLFLMLALVDDLVTALRLRGGLSRRRYLHNSRSLAMGLGLLLVRAIGLSERLYDVLRLRGYAGRLAAGAVWRATRYDPLPLAPALLLLGAVLAFRIVPGAGQYNGYLLAATALALLVGLLTCRPRSAGTR